MATPASRTKTKRELMERSFDVVVKRNVGTIELNSESDQSPIEAAFRLVATSGDEGDFEFIMPARMSPSNEPLKVELSVVYSNPKASEHPGRD